MTDSPWSLVLPVLVTGLALGVAWVYWWRHRSASRSTTAQDRELLLSDLRARQEVLYAELRQASGAERHELELAAARNLKAIEDAGGDRDGAPAAGVDDEAVSDASTAPATAGAAAAAVPARRTHSGWLGFLGGVACAGLIGVLVFWAQRDARPREDAAGPPPAPVAGGEHPAGDQLTGQDAAALEQLARAVDGDPTDIMARKQYAVGLLSTGQFVAAFAQAEILLESNARDPDGLYVAGMVRMRMGQEQMARDLLGSLIEDFPDHVPALTALGVLELRASGLEAAEAVWDRAIAASGGSNPEIERLIAAAREQFAGSAAPGAAATPGEPASVAPRAAPAPAADAYNIRLELAEGLSVPPGAVLFISLRKGDVGPPAAARRIPGPRFPMTVSLSAADSMLGRPLPTDASVWARLDSDGSASTREDDEPFAETMLEIGASAVLTLQ
jgi:tetratricopeptide (TPR) repeat protein